MYIRRLILPIFSLFISSLLFINCGGGGGGGSTSVPEEPENPPVVPQSTSIIKGLIHIGEELNNYPTGLVSVVEVISVDKKGEEIDRKNVSTTDGRFSINTALDENGGSIVITINTDGYTPGTKTINYKSPDDFKNLTISVRIDPVAKRVISISEISVTAKKEKVIKVNFYENKEGDIYTAEKSQDPLMLSLAIPIEKLQEDVENVLVEYKGYKPSNPRDYQNFPGTYTDNDEELISIGFFTLDIKDPKTGRNPFVSNISPQLVKNKGEYYRLLSFVDCEQLLKIKEILGSLDEDPDKEGVQVTFYAFDFSKGKWVKAGIGTFVDNEEVEYEQFGEDPNIIDTPWDYIVFNGCVNDEKCSTTNLESRACVDVDKDNKLEDVSCVGNNVITNEDDICTTQKEVFVVVSVTNPELQWKNLDYIKPAVEKLKISFSVSIKDDKGNPLAVPVYVYPDFNSNCIDPVNGVTSEKDGKITFETIRYCSGNTVPVHIQYINPFTNQYELYSPSPSNISDGQTINITISNPLKCKLTGKVEDTDGNPKEGIYVFVEAQAFDFYNSGYTNEEGIYSFNVPCDTSVKVVVYPYFDKPMNVNVNGVLELYELNDDGSILELKTYRVKNNPPDGYAYLSTNYTKWGAKIDAYIYAWDYEGDIPIRYKLKFINQNNEVVKSYTGQIRYNYGFAQLTIDTSELPEKSETYRVVLVLVDSGYNGNINSLSQDYKEIEVGILSVNLPEENTPPSIVYFYVTPNKISRVGLPVNIYGNGYDIDGDTLSSNVYYRCIDNDENVIDSGFTPNGQNVLYRGYEEFIIPNNQKIKICQFYWYLKDGKVETVSDPVSVVIENTPPSVYIWPEENVVSVEKTQTTIYAIVNDPDGDNLTCNWYVNNVLDNDQHSCDEYILSLEGFDPRTDIDIKLEVTDGIDTSSSTTKIHYGQPSNLDIIIQ